MEKNIKEIVEKLKEGTKEEKNEILMTLNKEDLKQIIEYRKKELKELNLDIIDIKYNDNIDFLNKIEIIDKENIEVDENFYTNPDRYLKFQTKDESELGILAVNPYININEFITKDFQYFQNINILEEELFNEVVAKFFIVKVYDNKKASESIDNILLTALNKGCSDIYIRVNNKLKQGKVQFRIDEKIIDQKEKLSLTVCNHIRTSLAEQAGQDSGKVGEIKGKITRMLKGKRYEFRLSILDDVHGYQINLRILHSLKDNLTLEGLGYIKEHANKIESLFKNTKNGGLILVTGATGSGKTTSLNVILRNIYKETNMKIITMEDPVEIAYDGFIQVQMSDDAEDEKYKVSYADTIKICLRQKPDILLIGEIRDEETAAAAIQAALSGHLTISTLHSATVRQSISRLRQLKVKDYDINDTLKGIISQRLEGKLCKCKLVDEENTKEFIEEEINKIKNNNNISEKEKEIIINKIKQIKIYKPNPEGCELCKDRNPGFYGKTPVYEIGIFKINYIGDYKDFYESMDYFLPFSETAKLKMLNGEIDYKTYLNYIQNY